MFTRTVITLGMAGCLWLALAAVGGAQPWVDPRAGPPRVVQMPIVPQEIGGTFASAQPGLITINTLTNEPWTLRVSANAYVRVAGKAEEDVLRPGTHVRFEATVDKKTSKVLDKVSKLVVFAPTKEEFRSLGVFLPGQCLNPFEHLGKYQTPQEVPMVQPGVKSSAQDKPQPSDKLTPADVQPPEAKGPATIRRYDIHGQIVSIKGRYMTVYTPTDLFKPNLRVELADNVQIEVDLNNYLAAQPGDKVAARGFQVAPKTLEVLEVLIERQEPLSTKRRPKTIARQPAKPDRPEKQEPFEVAQATPGSAQQQAGKQQDTPGATAPEKPQPGGAETKPGPATPPAGTAEQPGGKPQPGAKPGELIELMPLNPVVDKSQELLDTVRPRPDQGQQQHGLMVSLDGGEPTLFVATRAESIAAVRKKFGDPDKAQFLKGVLPVGQQGAEKEVQWQLWTYGPVRLMVDENGTVRYVNYNKQ